MQDVLGIKLKLSSAYHPHTDGQTRRTIQSLEDLYTRAMRYFGWSHGSDQVPEQLTIHNMLLSVESSSGVSPIRNTDVVLSMGLFYLCFFYVMYL